MRKLSELEKHFKLPTMNGNILTTLVIMKNGNPVYRDIHISGKSPDYRITSCSQEYDSIHYPILDLTDIPRITILNTTVSQGDGEYGVYKSLRLHFKEILRTSDIGPMLNRYYGVLSGRLIHKYLDEFIIKSLKSECCDKETFAENYKTMLNTLITTLDTKANTILKSIRIDCTTVTLANEIISPLVNYNVKDAEFTSLFEKEIDAIRMKADPNGLSKYVKYDDPEIKSVSYLGFYKTEDGQIAPFINDEKTNSCSSILLKNFDNFRVMDSLSELIYNHDKGYNYPTIHLDKLNIILVKYKNKNNLMIMIAGNRHNSVMFPDTTGITSSGFDEIFEKLNDLKYLKLYKEKSIKNLWGLLNDISCI